MRRYLYVVVILAGLFAVSGCATTKRSFDDRETRMVEGTGIGAVTGAVVGGIVGHQSGNTAEGALIGGAVGAAGGAAVGAQVER